MQARSLGRIGIAVDRLIVGCGNFGGVGSPPALIGRGIDERAAFETLDEAIALGLTPFSPTAGGVPHREVPARRGPARRLSIEPVLRRGAADRAHLRRHRRFATQRRSTAHPHRSTGVGVGHGPSAGDGADRRPSTYGRAPPTRAGGLRHGIARVHTRRARGTVRGLRSLMPAYRMAVLRRMWKGLRDRAVYALIGAMAGALVGALLRWLYGLGASVRQPSVGTLGEHGHRSVASGEPEPDL